MRTTRHSACKRTGTVRRLTIGGIGGALVIPLLVGVTVDRAPAFIEAPSNDRPAGAKVIGQLPYEDGVNTSTATVGPEDSGECISGKTVWYRFTPRVRGTYMFSTVFSGFETVVNVYTSDQDELTPFDCTYENFDFQALLVQKKLEVGVTYYISVGGCCPHIGEPTQGGSMNLDVHHLRAPRAHVRVSPTLRPSEVPFEWTVKGTFGCRSRLDAEAWTGDYVAIHGVVRQRRGSTVLRAPYFAFDFFPPDCSKQRGRWDAISQTGIPGVNWKASRPAYVRGRVEACTDYGPCTRSRFGPVRVDVRPKRAR